MSVTAETSVHQQHPVSMPRQFHLARSGVHLLSFSLFFFLLTLCKSGWWMERCSIWVVGIALTASLWPHWLFYFLTPVLKYVLRLIWTFFVCYLFFFFVFLVFSLLISYPLTLWVDFVACETWYLNLSLIWILEWGEKKKYKEYPVHSKHTYTCKNYKYLLFFLFFLITSNVYMIDFI